MNSSDPFSQVRSDIQDIDDQLIELLVKRFKRVEEIGRIKAELGLPVINEEVWDDKIGKLMDAGESQGLTRKFVRQIFRRIHHTSCAIQEKVIKKSTPKTADITKQST